MLRLSSRTKRCIRIDSELFSYHFLYNTLMAWCSYMTQFIDDIKTANAVPIISTHMAWNRWSPENRIISSALVIPKWQDPRLARDNNITLVHHHQYSAVALEAIGQESALPFSQGIDGDCAFNEAGARAMAEAWIVALKCANGNGQQRLLSYLSEKGQEVEAVCSEGS